METTIHPIFEGVRMRERFTLTLNPAEGTFVLTRHKTGEEVDLVELGFNGPERRPVPDIAAMIAVNFAKTQLKRRTNSVLTLKRVGENCSREFDLLGDILDEMSSVVTELIVDTLVDPRRIPPVRMARA